ncbi:MAG TPA: hypothetical protein VGD22_14625 [Sphingobacteriaceae bacterium]
MNRGIFIQKSNFKGLIFTIITSFFVIITSCSKEPQLTITAAQPVSEVSKTQETDLITVEVTFNSQQVDAGSIITPLKYNKTSAVNFEFDDNPASAFTVFQLLKSKTVSDGTGKPVGFTATCAVNSRGNYNNGDLWENYLGHLTKQQAIEMIGSGWTLANHGLYHSVLNPNDKFGFGKPVSENISENTKYVLDKTGFKMRTLVVPSNDAGYLAPAFDQGILATSSTNSFDGFQSYPLYGDYVDISSLPLTRVHLRRDFNDRWDATGTNAIKAKLTTLFNKSNEKERMLYRLGTHIPDAETFSTLSDHILTESKGNCWVTTTQEMMEYLHIKNTVVKKESLTSGKLVITLDMAGVDKETFFKEVTLKINADAAIKTITVKNARSASSAVSTGIVNIGF